MTATKYKTFTADQLHDLVEGAELIDHIIDDGPGDPVFSNYDFEEHCDFTAQRKNPDDFYLRGEVESQCKILLEIAEGLKSGKYKLEIA